MTSPKRQAALSESIGREIMEREFRRDITPLIEAMRKHFEAEDALFLAMHPGAQERN